MAWIRFGLHSRRLALSGAIGLVCLSTPVACAGPTSLPQLIASAEAKPTSLPLLIASEPAAIVASTTRALSLLAMAERWSEPHMVARLAAEVLGTGMLVQLGCAVACADRYINPIGVFGSAALWGMIVALCVYSTRDISGAHLNPAVTTALCATGKHPWEEAPPYIAAQLLGATVRFLCVNWFIKDAYELVHKGRRTPARTAGHARRVGERGNDCVRGRHDRRGIYHRAQIYHRPKTNINLIQRPLFVLLILIVLLVLSLLVSLSLLSLMLL